MKYNDSLSIVALLLVASVLLAACETSKAERTEPSTAPATLSLLSTDDQKRLIQRAEKARDRTFDKPPTLEATTSGDMLETKLEPAQSVRDDRALLVEQLFGAEADRNRLDNVEPAYASLARYDAGKNRVVYLEDHPDDQEREAAIVAALIGALDAQHFDELPAPKSWDEQLAFEAAKHSTVSFALARYLFDSRHPQKEPELLARRPELAAELAVLQTWLEGSADSQKLSDRLAARQQSFVLREGLALGAALYRSSGWSGVELSRLMPPEHTADVVRPDQWMAGEPVGEWQWPEGEDQADEGDNVARKGRVGPAVASMWLEDVIAPQLARTVYAGYISDAYRFFKKSDDASARFEWLSVWDTPNSAQQVARAFEKRLRKRFEDRPSSTSPFVVFQKGLKVGVIISEAPQEEQRTRAQHLLKAHKLSLRPRDGLPTSFVPTRRDRLAQTMQEATMEARVWKDPATGLRLDLSKLGDDWTVQQPDHGPVRWFASHPDGSLLQLTVELNNPLGPAFTSNAYRERLVEAFQGSLRQAKLEQVAPTDKTPARGLRVRISGEVENAPRTLQLWQFERDDLIVSYSLQAPPEAFDEHNELAESILEDARMIGADHRSSDDPPSDGTIEYEVED